MSIAQQHFTDAGRNMLGRANAGALLSFDTIVIGAGVAAAPANLYPLTALIDHRFDVAITAKVDQGNGVLILDGVINSADIPAGQGFNLCELGCMAHIALEAPALYSVANVLATTPDYIPDAVENPTAVHAFKIKVVIDRATNVTVVLGTSTDILGENMGPAMDPNGVAWPGVFHEKLANTLRFKRLTPGEGIEITEEAIDPFNITIAQKVLKVDLDLYVPVTHPGAPNPEVAFPTIQDALDSLDNTTIPPILMATVHVMAGDYAITAPIKVTHQQSDRIRIIGETGLSHTITSANQPTGGPGSYSIVFTLDSAADIVVGDYVLLPDTLGTWPENTTVNGTYLVTAVGGNDITILTGFNGVYVNFAITGGIVIPLKTRIKSVANINALDIQGSGLLLLQNFGFISDQSLTAIYCSESTVVYLDTIGMCDFITGVEGRRNSYIKGNRLSIIRCLQGIYCVNSVMELDAPVTSYGNIGIDSAYGNISIRNSAWLINNGTALQAGQGVISIISGFVSVYWNNSGLYANNQSCIDISNTDTTLDFRMYNALDITLNLATVIALAGMSKMYYTTANIPPGFSITDGCYLPPSS